MSIEQLRGTKAMRGSTNSEVCTFSNFVIQNLCFGRLARSKMARGCGGSYGPEGNIFANENRVCSFLRTLQEPLKVSFNLRKVLLIYYRQRLVEHFVQKQSPNLNTSLSIRCFIRKKQDLRHTFYTPDKKFIPTINGKLKEEETD